jgi:predicted RNA-binding Zn ribbon-like protein
VAETTATSTFTFLRGARVLDFVGTLGSRASDRPVERLPTPGEFGRWLQAAGLLADGAMPPSSADYQQALALREAIARTFSALVDAQQPAGSDIESINRLAAELARGTPYLDGAALVERWHSAAPVRLALGRLAAEAIRLASAERDRLTRCQLPGCGTLLLSRARNEPRRWCSMQTCGNRAKVAAFRARAQAPGRD